MLLWSPCRSSGLGRSQHDHLVVHFYLERAIRENHSLWQGSRASPGSALGDFKSDQYAQLDGIIHTGEFHHIRSSSGRFGHAVDEYRYAVYVLRTVTMYSASRRLMALLGVAA